MRLHQLRDADGGCGASCKRSEQLPVVDRVGLLGEAWAEIERADELTLGNERHDDLDASDETWGRDIIAATFRNATPLVYGTVGEADSLESNNCTVTVTAVPGIAITGCSFEADRIGRILIDPRDSDVVYVAALGELLAEMDELGVAENTLGNETFASAAIIDGRILIRL